VSRSIKKRKRLNWEALAGYCFTVPLLLHLLIFIIGPIVFGFWLSLHEWNGFAPLNKIDFVGLKQYMRLFMEDSNFLPALQNTFVFSFGTLIGTFVASLLLALMVNSIKKGKFIWRTIYFIPYVLSLAAISLVWKNIILQPGFGLVNRLFCFFGLPTHGFFQSPHEALPSLAIMEVWRNCGYYMLIFIAGLTSIPRSFYDAATVDGARKWHIFRYITLPLLKPTILFVLVINTIWSLQVFTQVYMVTNGGPGDATNVVVFLMYNTAFAYLRFGSATAMAFVLFIIILAFTIVEMRFLKEGGVRSY